MKSRHDISDHLRIKLVVDMMKLRDKHIAEIRKILDCDVQTASQIVEEIRYGIPPR